jgi:hypothetical protein
MVKKLTLKYMKLGAVVSTLLLIGVLAHAVADFINFKYGIAVSFIAVGTAVFAALNLALWHCPIIRYMYEFPDMRGTYEGSLQFSYRDENNVSQSGTMRVMREVDQSGYGVFFRTTFYKEDGTISSVSTTHEVEILVEDKNTVQLTFTYKNEGDPTQNFAPHHGTEVLRYNKKAGTIIGHYYTNRIPFQTKGTIELRKTINTK